MEKLKLDDTKDSLVRKIVSFINKNGHYAEIGHIGSVCAINAIINDRKYLIDVFDPVCYHIDFEIFEKYTYMLVNSFYDFIQQLLIDLVIKKI